MLCEKEDLLHSQKCNLRSACTVRAGLSKSKLLFPYLYIFCLPFPIIQSIIMAKICFKSKRKSSMHEKIGRFWRDDFSPPFTPLILFLTHQQQRAFENIVGKEEIARNEQFLPFPTMFSTQSDNCTLFVHIFDIFFFFLLNWHIR